MYRLKKDFVLLGDCDNHDSRGKLYCRIRRSRARSQNRHRATRFQTLQPAAAVPATANLPAAQLVPPRSW